MRNIFLYSTIFLFLIAGCGPQYVKDPNTRVLVTSQYEDGPVKIIFQDDCSPQLDCKNKSEAECAVALYHDSDNFIKEGHKLIEQKLYLSASLEFMQALTRLSEAEIRVERAKLDNFQDYQIVTQFNLQEKIKEKIKTCERLISHLKWKRSQ